MKNLLLLLLMVVSLPVMGQGDLSGSLKGQLQSNKNLFGTLEVPNRQSTKTGPVSAKIETGNMNLLANPGFDHVVHTTSWTGLTLTGTATGTFTSTTGLGSGKAAFINCAGGASGGTCSIYQDVVTTEVAQALVRAMIKTANTDGKVKVIARVDAIDTPYAITSLNKQASAYQSWSVPVVAGADTTGIKIEITLAAGQSISVYADHTYLGYQAAELQFGGVESQSSRVEISSTTNAISTYAGAVVDSKGAGLYSYNSGTGLYTALKDFDLSMSVKGTSAGSSPVMVKAIIAGGDNSSNTVPNGAGAGWQATASWTGPILSGQTFYGQISNGTTSSHVISVSATSYENVKGISSTNGNTSWASCGHTTSDFTGFGTVTNIETQCKRDGDDLLMRGKFTQGTTTAVEARVNLKLNGVALTSKSATAIPSIQLAGHFGLSIAGQAGYEMLIEPSVGYLTFGYNNGSQGALTKVLGNQIAVSGNISFFARIPINGWENSNVIVANISETVTTPSQEKEVIYEASISGTTINWQKGNLFATVPTPTSGVSNFTFNANKFANNQYWCGPVLNTATSQLVTYSIYNKTTSGFSISCRAYSGGDLPCGSMQIDIMCKGKAP